MDQNGLHFLKLAFFNVFHSQYVRIHLLWFSRGNAVESLSFKRLHKMLHKHYAQCREPCFVDAAIYRSGCLTQIPRWGKHKSLLI
jgi:hypothetical protein